MASFQPRVIKLTKSEGQTFGFFLRVEYEKEGHLIRNIEKGGPAEQAGLKDGDRVLRVNGTFVDDMEHSRVVELIKESGLCVTFHVLDEVSYDNAKISNISLSETELSKPSKPPMMNGVAASSLKPKLCFLVKTNDGFGFSLKSTKGYQGMFMTDVNPSGAAEKAGIKNNDRLIELNGENIESCTHDQIATKVKDSGNTVMFLLVDEETDRYYKNNKKLKLGASLATVKHLPHKPRITELTPGPDGYGYYLRTGKNQSGHFIKDIDPGSPAEKGGLKELDRLVAVNGEPVGSLEHEEVVEKIRLCGMKCTMMVMDEETHRMYIMGGVSPMQYWEEVKDSYSYAPAPVPAIPQQAEESASVPAIPVENPTPEAPLAIQEREDYKPKLCKLEKSPTGFGFHLNAIRGVPGQFFKEVVEGGPADRAGLKDDDVLIEVNGVNIENSNHNEVVEMIRNSGNNLEVLVAEKEAYDYFRAKQIPITTLLLGISMIEAAHDQPKPEESQEEEKEREDETCKRPDTPPSQAETRDRSCSSSSSSSSSEDEKF
uniref:PDZ domain containing 1 n=1 Tax=Lepisosteus oculatus TaxID=7918 RepID=W5MQX8_LEPOC|nr:PREDICTED: Na(+)/H(+) exchange regulatory cofactor NHE-RF3 isoform X1 [Lepisosteus oculatus]